MEQTIHPGHTLWGKTKITLEMIKWEHSVFALPFALTGALLAAGGLPPLRTLGWILVAMVSARSAAMAFNRWADAALDAASTAPVRANGSAKTECSHLIISSVVPTSCHGFI